MNSLKKRAQQGFTIVELLIVIVVIGILAALVITTYNGIQQKARNTERITDLKAMQGQLEAYYAQNGNYPSLTEMNTQPTTGNWWIQDNLKGLDKEALRDPNSTSYQLLATPSTGVYQYAYTVSTDAGASCETDPTTCTKYVLTAQLEGGGTDVLNSLN